MSDDKPTIPCSHVDAWKHMDDVEFGGVPDGERQRVVFWFPRHPRMVQYEAERVAHLIAAAPELLEALEAIVCALNVGRDRLGRLDADVMSGEALRQLAIRHQVSAGRDRMEQIKNVAEAAIRKARGEQ